MVQDQNTIRGNLKKRDGKVHISMCFCTATESIQHVVAMMSWVLIEETIRLCTMPFSMIELFARGYIDALIFT